MTRVFPTSLVGSYPQPDWLIDRDRLAARLPPRVRASELWRVDPAHLEQAQRDATELAIRDQERAGLDIITDGEIRRESYSNRFATALDGLDIDNPATVLGRSGLPNAVPRVTGPVRRRHPVEADDVRFLRANTDRTVKITVPGPFTMALQAHDEFYGSTESLALAYADAVGEEIRDLFAAGADIVQLDEPYLQANPDRARRYGVKAVNRALEYATGTTAVHLCFGYPAFVHDRPSGYSFLPELAACGCDQISIETAQPGLDCSVLAALDGKTIILGVLDLSDPAVETPETVIARVERALPYVPPARLVLAPDCGMKYLPREVAFGKLAALTAAAARLRAEMGSLLSFLYQREFWGLLPGKARGQEAEMDTLAVSISGDGAAPTLELSIRLPAGARVVPSVTGMPAVAVVPAVAGAPAVVPAVAGGPAVAGAPAVAGGPAVAGALAPARGTALGSARTWAVSTVERAVFTFAASFLSALALSGPFGIPAVDAALFAGASAALAVVTAAIRSLSPPTDDKTLDVVTRTGLTLLQAFVAAFVASTAGATHFSDWRAGALAGLAAALTALKGTLAVHVDAAKPTPASLVQLRPAPPVS